MGRLDGQVAMITGASRGFGRAMALAFAEEGAHVIIGYRAREEDAAAVAAAVEGAGRRALPLQVDVADPASVARFTAASLAAFGHIDVLINNAGVMDVSPFVTQAPAVWRALLDVNVYGTLMLTRALLPTMVTRHRGRIINLASQLGHVGAENFAVYAGTKGFILAFTRSLAREVGPYGITVNAICPGSIVTDMNRAIYPPERQAARAAELPLRRLGEPADVARAALYLASADAGFVTGQCLDVNGGSVMA